MVVSIELNDEERYRVLLAALALFLVALVVSLCLALAWCPLHKWLAKRHAKRQTSRAKTADLSRYARSQWHRNIIHQHQHQHYHANKSAPTCNGGQTYMGPPPAYEVALKATRLQSLTGNSLGLGPLPAGLDQSQSQNKSSPDWLKTALTNNAAFNQDDEPQLDLGDYFHQPREYLQAASQDEHVLIPMHSSQLAEWRQSNCEGAPPEPPVMMRLWVKLVEPGELVERARAQAPSARLKRQQEAEQQLQQQQQQSSQASSRRVSLTRQLSIPHLFGSLMTTLASSKSSTAICGAGGGQQAAQEFEAATGAAAAAAPNESGTDCRKSVQEPTTPAGDETREQQWSSLASDSNSSSENFASSPGDEQDRRETEPAKQSGAKLAAGQPTRRRRHSIPAIANSITSRVLHMNVASFSYVKDENLISTKKHNQLNFQHFYGPPPAEKAVEENKSGDKANKNKASKNGKGKMCQLLVSICDVENLFSSSCMRSRACMRLAQNSSIYVKCEILAPKSANLSTAATRLLRNPLKVLTHQPSSSASLAPSVQHATVHFASTLPATAIEPTPTVQLHGDSGEIECDREFGVPRGEPSRLGDQTLEEANRPQALERAGDQSCVGVNWRHEPSADGKSIVVFNSIPKQIAQQQQLAYTLTGGPGEHHQQGEGSFGSGPCVPVDLVQFDSVFVSPILAKSTLQESHIRLRVYTQCKYVNETCVAELKLPLKQLMRAQTGDNLGDIMASRQRGAHEETGQNGLGCGINYQQQRQADVILDNLLANLVTASTGSPLGTLIEQISAEEREDAQDAQDELNARNLGHTSSFRLSSWLPTAASSNNCDEKLASASANGATAARGGAGLQRASCSLGAALNQLDMATHQQQQQQGGLALGIGHDKLVAHCNEAAGSGACNEPDYGGDSWQDSECDKLIERNYCRSLMVSHWLNYLVAPSYECQPVEESRGKLVLGLTYLPTSNRIIFNAHRASVEFDACHLADKQLIKRLRLHSDTSYLLRFMMVANDRVLKRKQTACSRKPEWDSQGAVTFDLVSVSVEQPRFIVALVMRNSRAIAQATGSLQSLSNHWLHSRAHAGADQDGPSESRGSAAAVRSDSELLRHSACDPSAGDLYRAGSELASRQRGKRDLVVGHLVLDDDIWHELRAQPRRQIIRQFKLV